MTPPPKSNCPSHDIIPSKTTVPLRYVLWIYIAKQKFLFSKMVAEFVRMVLWTQATELAYIQCLKSAWLCWQYWTLTATCVICDPFVWDNSVFGVGTMRSLLGWFDSGSVAIWFRDKMTIHFLVKRSFIMSIMFKFFTYKNL